MLLCWCIASNYFNSTLQPQLILMNFNYVSNVSPSTATCRYHNKHPHLTSFSAIVLTKGFNGLNWLLTLLCERVNECEFKGFLWFEFVFLWLKFSSKWSFKNVLLVFYQQSFTWSGFFDYYVSKFSWFCLSKHVSSLFQNNLVIMIFSNEN